MSNQLTMQTMTAMIQQMSKECRSMDTPLHEAAYAGEHEELKHFLYDREMRKNINSKNRLGCTPLRLAASGGHSKCVRRLLDYKAKVNVSDMKAQTPLAVAVKKKNIECIKMLLEAGANPDGDPQNMWTPLYLAAMEGALDAVKALVKGGASINGIFSPSGELSGNSILYITIAYHHWNCFSHLLTHGADPDCKAARVRTFNNRDESLYHSVIRHNVSPKFAQLLYDYGADLYCENFKGLLAREMDSDNECLELVKTFYGETRSLKSWCRIHIIRNVKKRTSDVIEDLPLPTKLIWYLQFSELC